MHPIEHLRYVARAKGLDATTLAYEAAEALGDLGDDERALVTAARRLVAAHPHCGPLWWAAAQIIGDIDPLKASRRVMSDLACDTTSDELAAALPGGASVVSSGFALAIEACSQRPDLTLSVVGTSDRRRHLDNALRNVDSCLVEMDDLRRVADAQVALTCALAISSDGVLVDALDAKLIRRAASMKEAVWVVISIGCVLPSALFDTCCHLSLAGADAGDLDGHCVRLSLEDLNVVIGSEGAALPTRDSLRSTCPVPSELCVVS